MPVVAEDVPPPATISEHPAHHPRHKLKRTPNDGQFFVCDGCMEPGVGTRYRCEHELCNFDLHTYCAVAPDTLTLPTFGDHVFLFLCESEPPAATTNDGEFRVCVACGEDLRGFVYHCFDENGDGGLDLHPCCANQPERAFIEDCVFALRKETSRPHDTSDDDEKRGRAVRPAATPARHSRLAGAGRQVPPLEHAEPDGRISELRASASSRFRALATCPTIETAGESVEPPRQVTVGGSNRHNWMRWAEPNKGRLRPVLSLASFLLRAVDVRGV